MGYYCTVPQCTSLAGKTKNVKFHRFPRDKTMADKWNMILKRGKPYTKYSKVCSLHFTQSDYNVTTMGQWKTLSKDAMPSQNLPRLNADGTVMVIRKSRTVKYRQSGKECQGEHDKSEKCWSVPVAHTPLSTNVPPETRDHDPNAAYRLQTLSAIASALPPQLPLQPTKPKKQDAFMQTDPIASEDDDLTQPNNSYSETSDTSFNSEQLDYPMHIKDYPVYEKEKEYMQYKEEKKMTFKEDYDYVEKKYEDHKVYTHKPLGYTKQDDYIPQTNEEYNKEAEKYALERKSLNGYEKQPIDYQKPDYQKPDYQKPDYQKPDYQKAPLDNYQLVPEYISYYYPDSVEILRNQQHNLEMLQQTHRNNENQNFFNENHIKQEIDLNTEEEKYIYERAKDQLDANATYDAQRTTQHQRLLEQLQQTVKQEPGSTGCDSVMQPQGSPYYPPTGHTNGAGGYYDQRPGPELLIAKQNALAAHTQLWQNTMKRPFFYSETPHYPLHSHRYEDLTRILQ